MANKIVIWDAFDGPVETPEQKIRPRESGILQVEMQDTDLYVLYEYPDTVLEYESIDDFRAEVTKRVKSALRKQVLEQDLDFEVGSLVDRGIALMCNFKTANINLAEKLAMKVLPPPEHTRGRARIGNIRI